MSDGEREHRLPKSNVAEVRNRSRSDLWIWKVTTVSVLLVAVIAAVVSFRHMHELAMKHGEDRLAAALIPLAVDGTIVTASMSLLLASRSGSRGGALPWIMLVLSSLASLGANIAVAEPTFIGRVIAGWPSFALIGAYEMLMSQIRRSARRTDHDQVTVEDEEQEQERGDEDAVSRGRRGWQRTAWIWAQEMLAEHGELPTGLAIARQFGRSARWGRLVKEAGVSGRLAEHAESCAESQ
ncbi:DUF2637 domain-containing protein [Nonomuraea insulae]|uniref:DUF2637 domain-containing protein n=1 Tax=Nonomuraea insulae TaxID=1616787 RepID=A0ABW1D093_9ACTN